MNTFKALTDRQRLILLEDVMLWRESKVFRADNLSTSDYAAIVSLLRRGLVTIRPTAKGIDEAGKQVVTYSAQTGGI